MSDWKGIISNIAPVLGTALGGPFGGIAAKAVTGALLGDKNATDDIVVAQKAITDATPDQLLALKQADGHFKVEMERLGVELSAIAAKDRNSARLMQRATKSWVVPTLAIITVGGFFAVIGFVLTGRVPLDSTVTGIVIGAVASKAEQVYGFFFGSSEGSKDKTKELAEAIRK